MDAKTPHVAPRFDSDELDFVRLLRIFWNWKAIILGCTVLFLLLGLLYLHLASYTYTASMKVTAVARGDGASSRIGGLGSLGGLASLAGIRGSVSQSASPFDLYIEGLHSRAAAEELARNDKIMRTVFAKEWDAASGRWREPEDALAPLKATVKTLLGIPRYAWRPPNSARLQGYISTTVKIDRDPKEPIVTVSVEQGDPAFAVLLLKQLDAATDQMLRKKMLGRSMAYTQYLAEKLRVVTLAEHRQALAEALSEQERSLMMASSSTPIAAEIVEEPVASYRPTQPKPVLVLAFCLLLGGIIGSLIALLTAYYRGEARGSLQALEGQ